MSPDRPFASLMTGFAGLKVLLMVTLEAGFDIRFRQGRYFGRGRCRRMRLMAAHAIRDIFQVMGHVSVRVDLLPAWREIAGQCRSEFFERPVARQALRRCAPDLRRG